MSIAVSREWAPITISVSTDVLTTRTYVGSSSVTTNFNIRDTFLRQELLCNEFTILINRQSG